MGSLKALPVKTTFTEPPGGATSGDIILISGLLSPLAPVSGVLFLLGSVSLDFGWSTFGSLIFGKPNCAHAVEAAPPPKLTPTISKSAVLKNEARLRVVAATS